MTIPKTIAAIRKLPKGEWISSGLGLSTDDLHALVAHVEKLEEGLDAVIEARGKEFRKEQG